MRSRCLQAAHILHCYTMPGIDCRPGLLQDGAGERHALFLAAAQHEAALATTVSYPSGIARICTCAVHIA